MKITSLGLTLIALCAWLSMSDLASAQQRRRAPRRPRNDAAAEPTDTANSANTPAPTEDAGAQAAPTPATQTPAPPAPTEAAGTEESAAESTTSSTTDPASTAEPTPSVSPDLSPLRQEYAAIMDELVKARARVAIVGKALFKTKLRIILHNRATDAQSLQRLVLRLDGAPIYRNDGGGGLEDGAQVFEGFATPGPHLLDVEAEQRSRANDGFGYTLRDTLRVSVQKDHLTEITIVLDDDSDMAEDFPEDGEGEYDLRTRVTAATYELEAR